MTVIATITETATMSLNALPWSADVVLAVLLISGLLMWGFGRRLVRPLFLLVAAALIGSAGFFLLPEFAPISPGAGLLVGAIGGAIAGLLLFRIAMASILAAVLTITFPAAACVVMQVQPSWSQTAATNERPPESEHLFLDDVPVILNELSDNSREDRSDGFSYKNARERVGEVLEDERVKAGTDRAREFLIQLGDELRAEWSQLPDNQRWVIVTTSLLGSLIGFFFGLTWPKHVAALTTASAGAAVWIPAGSAIAVANNAPGVHLLPESARMWIGVWMLVAACGALLQWTALKPRADKKKDESD